MYTMPENARMFQGIPGGNATRAVQPNGVESPDFPGEALCTAHDDTDMRALSE
jgi:hypothetical protein